MARILWLILILSLLCANVVSGQERTLRDELSGENCPAACFLGIIPGRTTQAELEDILNNLGIPFDAAPLGLTTRFILYDFDPESASPYIENSPDAVTVIIGGDTVGGIFVSFVNVKVQDILNWYGAPTVIGYTGSNGLVYREEGLDFTISNDDFDTVSFVEILSPWYGILGSLKLQLCQGSVELCSIPTAPAPVEYEISPVNPAFVSPTGSGNLCSLESPCSLTTARDRVRQANDDMTGDIYVYPDSGTYTLSEPFELTAEDSGTNGFNIIYRAYPGETPILSGGRAITDWTLFDREKNIYRADIGDLQTRQLYVNGQRAIRARGDENPRGWRKTDTGYIAPDESMASWRNPADIEIVAFWEWKSFRCGIDSIEGRNVTMQQPCWTNANIHKEFPINLPTWIENAYELLDSEREWYLDSSEYIYYKPAADEDLSTAEVIAPVLETLVSGVDVKNVVFGGLTFAYATWLHPSSDEGYPVLQAAWHFAGGEAASLATNNLQRTPGNVTFTNPQNMGFYNNRFIHLGGVGLNLDGAAQDNEIERNQFEDISSTGIQLGQINDASASVPSVRVLNNVIRNNTITRIGQEYFEGVGIFLGYTDSTLVTHNTIFDVPYSGISVGWGWGQFSYARRNEISYNRIEKIMQVLRDGGGIYTLSPQFESVIEYNYIRDQRNPYGGLYLDEGSQFFTVQHNVVENVHRWLHIWTDTIRDNTVRFNCADTREMLNNGLHNTISDNQVGMTSWPPECQEIIDNAGVEP